MKPFKKRPVAVFKISSLRRYGNFKDKVVGIVANISGNTTMFAAPVPTVLVVNGHIADMENAQTLVQQRVPGSVATRDDAVQTVVDVVGRKWLGYVQGLADAVDFEQALIIITSSGFDVKVNNKFMKPQLRIKPTDNPTTIKLIAVSAGSNSAYEWQQSNNNGASWIDLPVTNVANTVVSGLTSKFSYLFRKRSVRKNITSGWTASVSITIP